jgi:hypothetical protein
MSDVHAVDYDIDGEGNPRPPEHGLIETQDYVLACILGTLGFPMRGHVPVVVIFNADNIAKTILKPGKGNLRLCQVKFYFFYEGPNHFTYGKLTYARVMAAYLLARLCQRKRRGESSAELERMLERARKACSRHDVSDWMLYEVAQYIDLAANIFVLGETVQHLASDPLLAFVRNLATPGGLAHVVQPLNQEKSVMAKHEFYKRV